MRKFLIVALIVLFVATNVKAAVETYEGTEDYYVLGAVENINVAKERARARALRDAREKAGVYIHTLSVVVNSKMVKDEIISVASGVMRIIETTYDIIKLTDMDGYIVRATVKADIDTGDVEKFLTRDAEEVSQIVANETLIRHQEQQQDQKIEALKEEYVKAATPQEKETIAKQIVEEDKVFLSNVKLREGNKFRDEGNHKQAAKLFTEAIELNPDNALAWHNRGWAYIEQKKYKEALTDFNKATAINPDSEFPYFGRGWVYNLQKQYEAAVKEYDKVIRLNPRYAVAWNNRGAAKSWQNKMAEALEDYDKAIELNPRYAKAYENRGKALNALGSSEKAAEDLKRAKAINSSNKGADKIIEEVLALNKQGNYDEALELLNQAAQLYPDNQFVFVNRGNIYNDHFRDYEAAIVDYNKTIELNPKFSWPYMNRALAYGRLKRWDDAIADYGRAIELDQNYADAYNGRAWSYCKIGKFAEALPDVNKALELKPNEANYFDTRADVYVGLKRYDEALADMETALKLLPQGWVFYHRGEIYKLMGDDAKAQADFDKAKKLGYRK